MPLEPPSEPFPSGAPYWYWLGGRPAVDFVNTRRERWRRNVECLRSPEDLVGWLGQAGVLAEPVAAAEEHLAAAVALREAIDAAVRAAVARAAPPGAELAVIDGWLARGGGSPALRPGPDGLPVLAERGPADPLEGALAALALDAARMLGVPAERARLRICGSATCSARFYDRSPAGRRRWCSMALCGNAEKARRYRARAGGAAA